MRLIKENKITYKFFLESLKTMIENAKLGYSRKCRMHETIDFLLNLTDKEKQEFLIENFKNLDKQINNLFGNFRTVNYYKLYDPVCCLFELTKDNYDQIKEYAPEEISCLCFYAWTLDTSLKEKYAPLIFNRQICSEICKKFPNNLFLQKELYIKLQKEFEMVGACPGFAEKFIHIIHTSTEEELNDSRKKRLSAEELNSFLL